MIASVWGVMIGLAMAQIMLGILVGALGSDYFSVLAVCSVAGGLGLTIVLPAISKEYFQPRARTTSGVIRLFLSAIIYGFASPFRLIYTVCRLVVLKYWLICRIHKHNRTLEEIRISLHNIGISVQERRDILRKLSRSHRGNPVVAVHQLKNENLRMEVRRLDKRREELLWECHRIARKLGTKLKVYETSGEVGYVDSVIHLIWIRIEKSSFPVNIIELPFKA